MNRKRKIPKFILSCFASLSITLAFCAIVSEAAWGRGEDRIRILIDLKGQAEKETEIQTEPYFERETATEPETESESETGPETETGEGILFEPETLTEPESKAETEILTESESEAGTESDSMAETEFLKEIGFMTESEAESEMEGGMNAGNTLTIPEDLESRLAQMAGIEPESESETETEEMESEPDETALAADEMLKDVQLGEDFVIPMQMPEELGTIPEFWVYHCGELSLDQLLNRSRWRENRTIKDLEDTIKNMLYTCDGEWSVYVKNLNTDESFIVNDTPMKSASVMKLFIMGTVYTEIEKGELERTDNVVSLLNKMITFSDNEASNELLYILGNSSYAAGIAKVNSFIQEYGYSDMTVEYNGFSNPATVMGDEVNQVAAKDVGQLLEDVYRRTWMNRAASNEAETLMLEQDTRYKIPAGLPEDVLCGNKSGEMTGTENDAAIVYSDACDYILVILSSDWGSSDTAVARIRNISSLTYEFFND